MPGGFYEILSRLLRGSDDSPDAGASVGGYYGAGEPEVARASLEGAAGRLGINWSPVDLGSKQELFAFLVPKLIERAHELGFKVRLGETLRTTEQQEIYLRTGASHVSRSLHQDKLAIDLNLMVGDRLVTQGDEHRPLGEWWEKIHTLARWGGRFGDGNHYSLEHGGRK